jgi:hypothetical protein
MNKISIIYIIIAVLVCFWGIRLLSQSALPPSKQAIESQYAQERAAGIQNAAPKDPNAPFPIAPELPFQLGIRNDCSPPFSSQNVNVANCWQGVRNGIKTVVYAGAEAGEFDTQQGIIYVMTIPDFPAETSIQTILTPVRAGAASIVLAQNDVLTLVSDVGPYVMVFDLNRETFTSVILDTTPPVISGMPAASCTLWPPNHQLIQVADVKALMLIREFYLVHLQ